MVKNTIRKCYYSYLKSFKKRNDVRKYCGSLHNLFFDCQAALASFKFENGY